MYQDYFLKFDTQAEADSVLFDEQTNVQGDVVETVKVPKYAAVDVIGVIYKPTGKMLKTKDESGNPIPEIKPLPGFHANVRSETELPELDQWRVTPTSPVRVWA